MSLLGRASFRNARFLLLGHMPKYNMVMRHIHSGVTRVEVEADVVNWARGSARVSRRLQGFMVVDVLDRDHVHRCDQAVPTIEAQERPQRQSVWLDKDNTQAWKEFREVYEVADTLVSALFGDLSRIWRRTNGLVSRMRLGAPVRNRPSLLARCDWWRGWRDGGSELLRCPWRVWSKLRGRTLHVGDQREQHYQSSGHKRVAHRHLPTRAHLPGLRSRQRRNSRNNSSWSDELAVGWLSRNRPNAPRSAASPSDCCWSHCSAGRNRRQPGSSPARFTSRHLG